MKDEQSQMKNRKHFQVNLMTREDFQEFGQKENSIKIGELFIYQFYKLIISIRLNNWLIINNIKYMSF